MGRPDLTSAPGLGVAVVGAGPVGLTLAIRLAQLGAGVFVLDQAPGPQTIGSRAICMQRETLEIWARAGVGEAIGRRGAQWHIGRTYYGTRELFSIELPGSQADHFPPFVNISQSEVDALLLARCLELGVEVRWGWRVAGLTDAGEAGVTLRSEEGDAVHAAYAAGADGAHSTIRDLVGVEFPGHTHEDRFLICDIHAQLPFPSERRFFFDPPWNPGRQVLIHPQPDDVWRIDWQIPAETDIDAEERSGGLERRIRAVIGQETPYELRWRSVYRFHQRMASRFRAGRVFLVGDAAHLFAPFGARGLNSGAADAENLAWKLAMVLHGEAPDSLLDSYEAERAAAARENLAVTDATMRFMAPHGWWERMRRDLILRGSSRLPALRRRVNSGKLAEPFVYRDSPIVSRGATPAAQAAAPAVAGAVAPDVALAGGGRLRERFGRGFVVLVAGDGAQLPALEALAWPVPVTVVAGPELTRAFAPDGPRAWVVRPDGHLAADRSLASAADVAELPALVGRSAGRRGATGG